MTIILTAQWAEGGEGVASQWGVWLFLLKAGGGAVNVLTYSSSRSPSRTRAHSSSLMVRNSPDLAFSKLT